MQTAQMMVSRLRRLGTYRLLVGWYLRGGGGGGGYMVMMGSVPAGQRNEFPPKYTVELEVEPWNYQRRRVV